MKSKTFGLNWVAYAALFSIVAVASAAWTISFLVGSREDVLVPDLIGKTLPEVEYLLSRQMLKFKTVGRQYSDDVPREGIVRQSVVSGEQVRVGRTIGLYLSKGPRERSAPQVTGLDIKAAETVLASSEIDADVAVHACSDEVSFGKVIAQNPRPGEWVSNNRISLLLSKGPCTDRFVMGSVLGLPLASILRELDRWGFIARSVHAIKDSDVEEGGVVSVVPSSGSVVRRSDVIEVTVSSHLPEEDLSKQRNESRLVRVFIELPPGFFRKSAKLRIDRGADIGNYALDVKLGPGSKRDRVVWLPPGGEIMLEVDGREIWRKVY